MADKRQWAPELWFTLHLYLLRHPPRSPTSSSTVSDKEGGGRGENGGRAAAFMCLYIDVSHKDEEGTA